MKAPYKLTQADLRGNKTIDTLKQDAVNKDTLKDLYSIKGKIVDIETKEELAFVNVSIDGTKIGCISDIYGNFELLVPDTLSRNNHPCF